MSQSFFKRRVAIWIALPSLLVVTLGFRGDGQASRTAALALVRTLPDPSATATIVREAGPNNQDVVASRLDLRKELRPDLTQLPFDPVPDDCATGAAGNRQPDPRLVASLARERVEDEEPGRDGAAVPVDGVEVPRSGETVPALH